MYHFFSWQHAWRPLIFPKFFSRPSDPARSAHLLVSLSVTFFESHFILDPQTMFEKGTMLAFRNVRE